MLSNMIDWIETVLEEWGLKERMPVPIPVS